MRTPRARVGIDPGAVGPALSEPLPALVDRKRLAVETGLTRAGVDAIFRAIARREGVVVVGRKPYVEREAVRRELEARRFRDGQGVR